MTGRASLGWGIAAALALAPSSLAAQPVAKASFVVDGSFALATAGEAAVQDPVALAWGAGDRIHLAGEKGPVVVLDGTGKLVRTYGAGTLKKVAAIAVDAAGLAYVLDPDAKSVFVFDPAGEVKLRIGQSGNAAGQLADPLDVALGPTGLLYVLDKGRKGVQVFGLEGTFLHDLLLPITTEEPRSLAVTPDGRVYVSDKSTPGGLIRLPELTAALATVDAPAQSDAVRVRGATMKDPVALAATATGTVAVADRETGIVWSVDGNGADAVGADDRVYGGSGSGRGSFRKIADVAVAGADELLVLDSDGRKIERIKLVLEAGRAPQRAMDYPVQFQTLTPPLAQGVLAAAPRRGGTAWYAIADAEGRNLRVIEAALVERTGALGDRVRIPEAVPGAPAHSFGSVVERAGHVALNDTLLVVTEPGRNRFQVFDLRTDAAIGAFGDNYRDDRRLRDPRGVALFADGRIAIADHGNDRIAVFSADLATLLGTMPLLEAEGVAVSPDGRLFAWDEEGTQASRLPEGAATFVGLPPSLAAGGVGAMAVDGSGNLYALRRGSARVAVLGAGMDRLLARVGSQRGLEKGDHLSVDPDGNIYATDLSKGATVVMRWGVDVAAVQGLASAWSADAADLSWTAVPGAFVTGYQIEGAPARDGPWSRLGAQTATTLRVQDPQVAWYRVSARTLTGAVGRPSDPAPAGHLAALAAFAARDWTRARALATEALATAASGAARADARALLELAWAGFASAHEAKDYDDALRWDARLPADAGPHAFERLFRLADTHQRKGAFREAMERALAALEAPAGATPEQIAALRQLVFTDAWELRDWKAAADMGEQILGASGAGDPALVERVARAHLESGGAQRAAALLGSGGLAREPSALEKRRFDMLGVVAATELGDYARALDLAGALGTSLDGELFVLYQGSLAYARLQTGDRPGARSELMSLVGDPDDREALAERSVARSAVALYGAYVEANDAEGAKAMLDSLIAVLPAERADVRGRVLQLADSVGAVADTRLKLGEGFQLYADALFRDALRFFQAADQRTDLDFDQRLIVKELLAGVLYSFQRIPDADEAYRGVFEIDPAFDLSAHLEHVSQVYGVTVFADEVLAHFSEVGPLR